MDCPTILGAATVAKGAVVANNLQSQQIGGAYRSAAERRQLELLSRYVETGLLIQQREKSLRNSFDE
jgi:hypothetical protein